ncbi:MULTISPECIES: helix-turn-helix domain-containing protein [Laspinema]|uniref:Helix-turn-helix transcriptional regulator n=1 Tax=Laspinema olomoucense D3b TaxID=2953688 RepID=A0ABT2NFK3_9CYAN|nr:helix-turn-helix transcriptional regulator [Laspinema sp. D3b]MCT7981468.1 helix-turn-helix transcriptional regulator [Laspinema sp. D3b]
MPARQPPPYTPQNKRPALQNVEIELHCRLDELMEERGLTQQELSEATKIGAAALRNIRENTAKRFDKGTLCALINYFNLESLDELFTIIYNSQD